MTSNSKTIIQDIRQEFEMLLNFVVGEQAQKATADHIERGLFKLLLAIGAKLLMLFFVMRSDACSRDPIQTATGAILPYERDTKRTYYSIFGKLSLYRPYFYKKEVGGETPLDAALGLGADRYSDLLREVSDYLGVYNVYHKTGDILARLLGLKLSTGAIESNIADDAVDVESYYAQKPPPNPAEEAEILVVQADGKGVPMVLEKPPEPLARLGKGQKRGRKQEAMVTSVYTIAVHIRTPRQWCDDARAFLELPSRESIEPGPGGAAAVSRGRVVALAVLVGLVAAAFALGLWLAGRTLGPWLTRERLET